MRVCKAIFLLIIFCIPSAFAGECGGMLRSLMLHQEFPAEKVAFVRSLCIEEAESGDVDSAYRLSFFYLGFGDWQPDKAIPIIKDSALNGVSEAQYWLAWQYETGPLLPNDTEAALRWYQAAGDADHLLALSRLAQAYQAGELGLPRNTDKAKKFRAAAARCSQ
jgi:TPR repeat protein